MPAHAHMYAHAHTRTCMFVPLTKTCEADSACGCQNAWLLANINWYSWLRCRPHMNKVSKTFTQQ